MTALIVWILFSVAMPMAQAAVCSDWAAPVRVGTLDAASIGEASGLAVSRQFPGRLYHHNDSGDDAYFYITDTAGAGTQKVEYSSRKPYDMEDAALGPCGKQQCLFLGDIGDNRRLRKILRLWIIPEVEKFGAKAAGARQVLLQYPDGAHDAEAIAVHPLSGDLYILTKEAVYSQLRAEPARLYRASAKAIAEGKDSKALTLESLGTLDLPGLLTGRTLFGQIATGIDISPDGERLLVLTYELAVELPLARVGESVAAWKEGKDFSVASGFPRGLQIEAIAYAADGRSFYFDSESRGASEAPLFRVDCR